MAETNSEVMRFLEDSIRKVWKIGKGGKGINETDEALAVLDFLKRLRFVQLAEAQSLPKSPFTYFSKRDRTPKEVEESFCDIGFHRAIDEIRADWRKLEGGLKG